MMNSEAPGDKTVYLSQYDMSLVQTGLCVNTVTGYFYLLFCVITVTGYLFLILCQLSNWLFIPNYV
jgi:hypothetical protein